MRGTEGSPGEAITVEAERYKATGQVEPEKCAPKGCPKGCLSGVGLARTAAALRFIRTSRGAAQGEELRGSLGAQAEPLMPIVGRTLVPEGIDFLEEGLSMPGAPRYQ